MYSRREFGKMVLAGLPLSMALAQINSRFRGVQIGAITYSFRSMPANEIIPAMVKLGLSEAELMSNHCEALAGAPQATGFGSPGRGQGGQGGQAAAGQSAGAGGQQRGGGRPQLTPEQQEAQRQQQEALRKWRMATSPDTFKAVKKKFNDAGINLQILCFNQRMTATDDEIEYAFQMAKALGVKAISSSSTVSFAKRVAPFADKHKIMWGGHGHSNINDPEEFATPQSFATIMSFSKYIGINLDIGHFTAANFDAVAYIKEHHARITNLHLKDRKKNQGPNVPWGQGDTPIKEVLQLMAKEKYTFPANIEFEYQVPEGSDLMAEMSKCIDYCKNMLA
jgi:sugar phosphate isomerase/epimerase